MVVLEDCARIEAIAHKVAAEAGHKNLKPEQVQAVVEFACGHDFCLPPYILATANLSPM